MFHTMPESYTNGSISLDKRKVCSKVNEGTKIIPDIRLSYKLCKVLWHIQIYITPGKVLPKKYETAACMVKLIHINFWNPRMRAPFAVPTPVCQVESFKRIILDFYDIVFDLFSLLYTGIYINYFPCQKGT